MGMTATYFASGATQRWTARLALTAVFVFACIALAAAGAQNIDKSTGLAIEGYDPVAYFTDDRAVKGDPAYKADHAGAVYHFASAEHRDLFVADPAKYAPQYGGYCAYGVAKGVKAGIELDKFTIVDGKLYLNYNGSVQKTWRKDIAGYLARSEENWQQLGAN